MALLPCFAFAADQPWSIDALLHALAQRTYPPVYYTETRQSAYLDIPLRSQGVLRLPSDGILVKERRQPSFERLTLSPTQITREDADGAAQSLSTTELPGIHRLSQGLAALFRGEPQRLRNSFDAQLEGQRQSWRLTLRPHDSQQISGLAKILVLGQQTDIQEIAIIESDGDSSVLELGRVAP
jgi:hypothetical protein